MPPSPQHQDCPYRRHPSRFLPDCYLLPFFLPFTRHMLTPRDHGLASHPLAGLFPVGPHRPHTHPSLNSRHNINRPTNRPPAVSCLVHESPAIQPYLIIAGRTISSEATTVEIK